MNREEVTDLIVDPEVKGLTWADWPAPSATARNGAPPPCSAR
jgi:hypothetical protein